MLFDTLGLTPIGLPDLQCHCKNLEPNQVVVFMRNLAAYLFEYGDVIAVSYTHLSQSRWRITGENRWREK